MTEETEKQAADKVVSAADPGPAKPGYVATRLDDTRLVRAASIVTAAVAAKFISDPATRDAVIELSGAVYVAALAFLPDRFSHLFNRQ